MYYLFEEYVEYAYTESTDQPLNSVLYGLFAQGGVVFLGAYALSQVVRFGSEQLVSGIYLVTGIMLLVLSGIGLTVVGIRITELLGDRTPWRGS
ncbi:hypothetical protein VB773_15475 [Haloarculaceae archaeon H-GB2-1]|nr:hypothetical protein [Haloarculaceae archaeon H-GB11]MEA5408827.1 hypothetical protein [Haloarculaceae archaeon H-GB2-1]